MGCTHSKTLEMQARMEGWKAPIAKSFSRSLSMPLRQKSLKQSPHMSTISSSGSSIASSGSGSIDRSGSMHIVALTSSTYGVLKMPEPEEPEEPALPSQDSFPNSNLSAPTTPQRPHPPPLPSVPEAEVIDLRELMKDLNEDQSDDGAVADPSSTVVAAAMNRKRKASSRVLSRSISSVDSIRELDVKIRTVALALPNLEKKLRALDALNSINSADVLDFDLNRRDLQRTQSNSVRAGRLQSTKSMKGLFYGATLGALERFSSGNLQQQQQQQRENSLPSALSEPEFQKQSSGEITSVSSSSYDASSSCGESEFGSPLFDPEILKTFKEQADNTPPRSDLVNGIASKSDFDDGIALKSGFDKPAPSLMSLEAGDREKKFSMKKMMSSKVCSIEIEEQKLKSEEHKLKVSPLDSLERLCPPGGEDRVVLYVTSLRGIRKTFEDCNVVRMILQGFSVAIDERDVSMHAEFRQELKELMAGVSSKPVPVPRLFIKGRYVGGAEEVAELNEDGLLERLLEGMARQSSNAVCDGCGGMRFVPCGECSGSCKVVVAGDGDTRVVARCPECNENGLVRCPVCL